MTQFSYDAPAFGSGCLENTGVITFRTESIFDEADNLVRTWTLRNVLYAARFAAPYFGIRELKQTVNAEIAACQTVGPGAIGLMVLSDILRYWATNKPDNQKLTRKRVNKVLIKAERRLCACDRTQRRRLRERFRALKQS